MKSSSLPGIRGISNRDGYTVPNMASRRSSGPKDERVVGAVRVDELDGGLGPAAPFNVVAAG
jgi:hypothetical protein